MRPRICWLPLLAALASGCANELPEQGPFGGFAVSALFSNAPDAGKTVTVARDGRLRAITIPQGLGIRMIVGAVDDTGTLLTPRFADTPDVFIAATLVGGGAATMSADIVSIRTLVRPCEGDEFDQVLSEYEDLSTSGPDCDRPDYYEIWTPPGVLPFEASMRGYQFGALVVKIVALVPGTATLRLAFRDAAPVDIPVTVVAQ
jgi:hypothetical protein